MKNIFQKERQEELYAVLGQLCY